MIPVLEIKEKARFYSVPGSTIERDYAQNWLLKHLSNINMVFKGGTGIRKTYFENYRFSDDLDFTLRENITTVEMRNLIKDVVIHAKSESGINFLDNVEINEVENGFVGKIYLQILRTSGAPLKIKLDFTEKERERILLPLENKKVFHPYSDDCQFQINTYSLEEIMAEKIRSLFQRTRPRDLYDVWYLYDKIDKQIMFGILSEKFKFKGVKFDISSLEIRKDDFSNAWKNSLAHQLKDLPDFENVFHDVRNKLNTSII